MRSLTELKIKTDAGTGYHGIWGFSSLDFSEAVKDNEKRLRMSYNMGRIKRLFVDLGVCTESESQNLPWSSREHDKKYVLGLFADLQGKACEFVNTESKQDPSKTKTYINRPRDTSYRRPLTPLQTSNRLPLAQT